MASHCCRGSTAPIGKFSKRKNLCELASRLNALCHSWIRRHGGRLQIAATVVEPGSASDGSTVVRTVDLARLVHAVDRALVRMHGPRDTANTKIVMKHAPCTPRTHGPGPNSGLGIYCKQCKRRRMLTRSPITRGLWRGAGWTSRAQNTVYCHTCCTHVPCASLTVYTWSGTAAS